ncbi:hypothetical protein KMZ32_15480 [Phycicoccus sp. MAQZ13P-2]|uniref:hypothetical protein n=1 Tax=Phycicoccus mangrovi TaxID=2840470 RepID=UPI001C0069DD|nr:hypothetical protein [Phycicoccus mangrovi]MBT9257033.1 hypothetical protein [Phycicoccus mangrovi]MBT9275477.1 hypothetical protein [Phycicoccus mangrovi]
MTAVERRRSPGTAVRGGALVAVSLVVMNVASYAFALVAARGLGPARYGAVAALMSVLVVVNVVSLGLQTVGARRVATDGRASAAAVGTLAARAALALAALCLLAAPLVAALLDLGGIAAAAVLAVPAGLLTLVGGRVGVLQGEERWGAFSAVFLALGLGRLVAGSVAVAVSPTPLGAMVGVAVGALAPFLLGWRRGAPAPDGTPVGQGALAREVARNAHALLAFFVLSSSDVVVARAALDAHEAGLYASGAILAKSVLFLPYFVTAVIFPALARGAHRHLHLWGLAVVGLIGAGVVGGALALPGLTLAFVGGEQYRAVAPSLWAFAVLGTVFACIQLLVFTALARGHRWAPAALWAGVLGLGAAVPSGVDAAEPLLAWIVAVASVVLVVLVLVTRHDDPAPAVEVTG